MPLRMYIEEALMQMTQSRRDFLASASLAAAAGVFGARGSLADEPPPEITTIRLGYWPRYTCLAPQSISAALLRAEGFTDVRFVPPTELNSVARGTIDFDLDSAAWLVSQVDAGEPLTVLAGVHVGCFELFAHEPIRTISDLKGKRVGIDYLGSAPHMYLSIMVAQVGLRPDRDIEWVANPIEAVATAETGSMQRFINREVDAFLGFPPEPQELRGRNIGRVILNTSTDAPWSYYYCCNSYTRRQFVRDYPIATKRCLRAILKAADICASDPQMAARRLVDEGFTDDYESALQTLTDLFYDKWREYDPEDSMRFYALRLHEVGMIKSSPNKIIADGTDWRFLNELKRELKT
jgi:NitT/TauT family transport system substrate-binding protein